MSKTDSKQTQNLEETIKKVLEPYMKNLESFIQERITSEIDTYSKSIKLREKMLMEMVETMQNTTNFALKEINYKIGGLSARNTRREKDSDTVMTTTSIEDALVLANKIRKDQGLPPLSIPNIDKQTNNIDQTEPRELDEK